MVVRVRGRFFPAKLTVVMQFAIKGDETADALVHQMMPRAVPFQDDAQDFFIVSRNGFPWDSIPDFVIGRPGYDNWLVDYVYHNGIDSVDVTKTLHAIHQTGIDGNMAGHVVRDMGFVCLCLCVVGADFDALARLAYGCWCTAATAG